MSVSFPTVRTGGKFVIKWTPRIIAVSVGGYYALGIAYETGLMAEIDKVAIVIIKHHVGYIGLGALMPTVQWYAAWTVRCSFGLIAGLLYDLTEKICLCLYSSFFPEPATDTKTCPCP